MSWAKETDVRTKEIFKTFYKEVDDINNQPIVIPSKVKFMKNINIIITF